jgi:uncharacterized protein YjbI with pentapeptide repeats
MSFLVPGLLYMHTHVINNPHLTDIVLFNSTAYLHYSRQDSKFDGTDFSNAIVDRATFTGSSLKGAIFNNAVLTGTNFEGADVEGADFTEAALGSFDTRTLCKNPTLKGENAKTGADTRLSVGCGPGK